MEIPIIEKTLRPCYYKKQQSLKTEYVGLTPFQIMNFYIFLDDEYLSEFETYKLKKVFYSSALLGLISPFVAMYLGYRAAPYFLGYIDKQRSTYRFISISFGIVVGLLVYRELDLRLIPNRHFHEVLTQPEPRGKYVRTVMKNEQPRKWAIISEKLHKLGYNFKEMNEYSGKETMPLPSNKFNNQRI